MKRGMQLPITGHQARIPGHGPSGHSRDRRGSESSLYFGQIWRTKTSTHFSHLSSRFRTGIRLCLEVATVTRAKWLSTHNGESLCGTIEQRNMSDFYTRAAPGTP